MMMLSQQTSTFFWWTCGTSTWTSECWLFGEGRFCLQLATVVSLGTTPSYRFVGTIMDRAAKYKQYITSAVDALHPEGAIAVVCSLSDVPMVNEVLTQLQGVEFHHTPYYYAIHQYIEDARHDKYQSVSFGFVLFACCLHLKYRVVIEGVLVLATASSPNCDGVQIPSLRCFFLYWPKKTSIVNPFWALCLWFLGNDWS